MLMFRLFYHSTASVVSEPLDVLAGRLDHDALSHLNFSDGFEYEQLLNQNDFISFQRNSRNYLRRDSLREVH